MRFFTFRQSNSGGAYDVDTNTGVGVIVVVEAQNAAAANAKASALGMSFYGGCDCCGPRWYDVEEGDGEAIPMAYSGVPLWCASAVRGVDSGLPMFIHWSNGVVERIEKVPGKYGDPIDQTRIPEGWRQIWNEVNQQRERRAS